MSADGLMWSAGAALVDALIAAMRSDAGVRERLGSPARLFDGETRRAAYPFAELERHEVRDAGASLVAGAAHTLTFSVMSRHGGLSEAKAILAALAEAAEAADLDLAGQRVVLVQPVYADAMRTRDMSAFRGVLRLRVITEAE